MLLKFAGSAAVLLACTGIGFFAASEILRRERQLRMLYAAFLLIEGDIRYQKSSLPEAFSAAAAREQGEFSEFFASVSERLYAHETESFEQVFCEQLHKTFAGSALTSKDIALLEQLSRMCGRMDDALQVAAIEWYLEQSAQVLKELARENREKATLFRRMGILFGIFLLVLLL